jgi:acetyltransferase-like isoleucine patch superfamily enzyme
MSLSGAAGPPPRRALLRVWIPIALLHVLAGMALIQLGSRVLTLARIRRLEGRTRARLWAALHRGVQVGAGVSVGRGCRLILQPGGRLVLADGCTVDNGSTLAVYPNGSLAFGRGCFVGHHATLAARDSIEFGPGTFLAELVSVRDHDHKVGLPPSSGEVDVAPVTIGTDVWLGAKVTVLRGARVGDRTVVGANAVVRGDLPSDVVAVGIPARIVRATTPTGDVIRRVATPNAPVPRRRP